MKKALFLVSCLLFLASVLQAQTIHIYPIGNPAKLSDKYTVTVSSTNSPVIKTTSGSCPTGQCGTDGANKLFNITTFSFAGTISITVTKLGSSATSCKVMPLNSTSSTSVSGGNSSVTLTTSQPGKYTFEFSDDVTNYSNIILVNAQPLETNVPDSTLHCHMVHDSASLRTALLTDTVLYFRIGKINFGRFVIPSRIKTIYLPGGCYAQGYFYNTSCPNITINGRGYLTNTGYPYHYGGTDFSSWYKPIDIETGGTIKIYGISILDPTGPMILVSGHFTIDGVTLKGPYFNNDGITPQGSAGGTIKNCFISDQDDGIVPYGQSLTIDNVIFWETQGAAIQLGWQPHSLANYTITNCTVIHDQNYYLNGDQGFISAMLKTATSSPVNYSNFTVSNITFCTPVTRFIDIRNDRPGQTNGLQAPWVFYNWTINNIHFAQSSYSYPLMYIHGFNNLNESYNLMFSNLYMNGVLWDSNLNDPSFYSRLNVIVPSPGRSYLIFQGRSASYSNH